MTELGSIVFEHCASRPGRARRQGASNAIYVVARVPDLVVRSGGSTSVDITRRGIDKAFGMRQLAEQTGISLDDILFVGDRLDEHGNDYPVLAMGVRCHTVTGWEDPATFLEELIPTL